MTYTTKEEAKLESEAYFFQFFPILDSDPNHPLGHNDALDAFRHAYTSAVFTAERGEEIADILGWANEYYGDIFFNQTFQEKNMDLWNNKIGREIGQITSDKNEIALKVTQAINSDALITDPKNDIRVFAGEPPNPIAVLNSEINNYKNEIILDAIDSYGSYIRPVIGLPEWLSFIYAKYTVANALSSPLIFDLDGDGVELTALTGANAKPVYWDVDNDGFAEASAWVKPDDGLLVLDRNNNGKIDNHSELFGTQTTDGFTVLRQLDSVKDNVINASDAEFANLKVWRDLNGDGISQGNELFSLAQLGIQSIKLGATSNPPSREFCC